MDLSRFLMNSVPSKSAMLVGLITLIGLTAQKKPVTECIEGIVRTIMGFVTLDAGAGLVVSSPGDFANIFQHAFGTQGIVPNNGTIVSVAQKSSEKEMATIIFFAMVINIMITRSIPWKLISLTSHHMLFVSMMVAVILATADMTGIMLITVDSPVVGVAMVSLPATVRPYMKKVTDSDDVAIGHFSTLSYVLAGFTGNKFDSKEYLTEDMNMLKSLLFLRGTPVAISFTMNTISLVACLFVDVDAVKEFSDGKNWLMFFIMQSITFATGVCTILQGVRMVIAEIVPAFKGISDKLIPNARPTLDCPVVFSYVPNAILAGFPNSFAAGLTGMFTLYLLNTIVTVFGVVPHFFVDAVAGVFGNATGKCRGAILGVFAQDLFVTPLLVFLLPVPDGIGFVNTTFSGADFDALDVLLGIIVR